jgi:FAD/FMN-containing dehydrogenase
MQMESAVASHDRRVAEIAARVRDLCGSGEPVHIAKGGVHHVVPLPNDPRFRTRPIDVSSLRHVLRIDAAARTCEAEPGVTFAELLRETLREGLMPMVVPELEGITLGGAVAGCSVESMSYRYGGFHDSCVEYELVSGAGEVLRVSREADNEAFQMLHGSYGTLGILTRLTFKLIPAKRFVRMEYRTLGSAEEYHAELLARCRAGDYDFIDGIVHSPREFVLCLGRFVDSAPYVSDYRWLEIFYKSTRTRREDYLSLEDYCFRYDTECHWLTRTIPPLEWKPVRFLVGRTFLGSTNLIRWSGRLAPLLGLKKRPEVVVDVFIPQKRFLDFYRWYEREFAFYPLWIVPYRIPEMYPWLSPGHAARISDEYVIDCAVYGKRNDERNVDYSRLLEDKTHEFDGIKTLISRNHYTEERFWEIYNKPGYGAVKARLDPHGVFKGLFEKFHRVE